MSDEAHFTIINCSDVRVTVDVGSLPVKMKTLIATDLESLIADADTDELLDLIGKEAAMSYFDLVEADEV